MKLSLFLILAISLVGLSQQQPVKDPVDDFLKQILELLKQMMPAGIPELGIPPLDPFDVPQFEIPHIEEDIITADVSIENLEEAYGGQEVLDELRKTNRFVPDKEFSGTDRTTAGRSGPVQFEKDEDDPFGLDQFLDTAKRASNGRSSDGADRRDRGGESSTKGR